MEGCLTVLVALVLGVIAGFGAYAGWWAFLSIPAAIVGWAVLIGFVVFILALCGVGILVLGDL